MNFLKKFTETSESKTETKDQSAPPSEQSDLLSSAKLVADAARSTIQNEPEKKYDNAEVAGATADLLGAAKTYGKLDTSAGVGSYVEKAENYLNEYESSHSTKPKAPEEPTTDEPKPPSDDISKTEEPTESAKPTSEEPKPSSEKEEKEEPVTDEEPKPSSEETILSHAPKNEEEEEEKPIKSAEPTNEEPKPSIEKKEEEPIESAKPSTKEPTELTESEVPSGLGNYGKIAEGFLKKSSEEDSAEGEQGQSGIGQCAKMAEGFLSKPSEGSNASADESSNAGGDILKMAGGFLGKN